MPGFNEIAKKRAAGAYQIPPMATPPNSGIESGEATGSGSLPAGVDIDARYRDHRQTVHSDDAQIDDLERELGMGAYRPSPPPAADEAKAPSVWDVAWRGLKDMPAQVPAGALNAVHEMGNGLLDLGVWVEKKMGIRAADSSPERAHGAGNMIFGEPDTMAGRMTNGISQFVTAFLPVNRAMQGMKVVQGATGLLRAGFVAAEGGLAQGIAFDPHEDRLSNLVQSHPSLANPVTAYLAADPADSNGEARFKNTLEGMGLGLVTDGLLGALKYIRGVRRMNSEAVRGATEESLGGVKPPPSAPPGAPAAGLKESAPVAAKEGGAPASGSTAPATPVSSELGAAGKVPDAAAEPTAQETAKAAARAELDAIRAMTEEQRTAHFAQFPDPADARQAFEVEHRVQMEADAERAALKAAGITRPTAYDYKQQKWVEGEEAIPLIEEQMKDQRSQLTDLTPEARQESAIAGARKHARRHGITDPAKIKELEQEFLDSMKAEMDGSAIDARRAEIDAWREYESKQKAGQAADRFPKEATPVAPEETVPRGTGEPAAAAAPPKPEPTTAERFEGQKELVSFPQKPAEGTIPLLDADGNEVTHAVNINLNKIDGTTDLKALILQVGKKFGLDMEAARRGVISDKEVQALARELNLTAAQLLERQRGQALNAEQLTASRLVLHASAQDLVEKAAAAAAPTASDIEKAAFLNALEAHKAIQAHVTGAVAEAGRALRALRAVVGVPGEKERARMLRELVSLSESGPDAVRVEKLAQLIAETPSVVDLSKIVQKSLTRRVFDAAVEVRVNNLLSSPKSFMTNLLSNTYAVFGKIGSTYLAEGLGALKKGSAMNADRIASGESAALLSGMIDGMWDGLRLVRQSIEDRTPIDGLTQVPVSRVPALSSQNFNFSGTFGQAFDYLGMMTRLPGHGLNMTDAFFKAVNYRMEIRRQAVREAAFAGLEGAERENFIRDFLANPSDEFKFVAQEEARVNTFTNLRPETGLMSEQTIRAIQGTAAGRVALPFLRTNFNLIDYTIQNSLLGVMHPQLRADIIAGGAKRDLALAKISFGTTLMVAAGAFTANGLATGGGPADKEQKDALLATGWRPYSLKIGNKYVAYNRVEPVGTILGMAADWAEIAGHVKMESSDVSDLVFAAAVTAAHIGPAENLVESMTDLGDFYTKPDKTALKWTSDLVASSIVPNAVKQLLRQGGDPKLNTSATETRMGKGRGRFVADESIFYETLNKLKASLPGFSESLPPLRNMFGEVVTYDAGLGPDWASPIYVSEEKDSPARHEMARLSLKGYKFDPAPKFIATPMGAIPMNAQQHDKYVQLAAGIGLKDGRGVKIPKLEDELNRQVKGNFPAFNVNPKYKDLDEQRFVFLNSIVERYRSLAEQQLARGEDPVGKDFVQKYTELGKVRYSALTGRDAPVTITAPGGGKVK